MEDLTDGTLADTAALGSQPPDLRRLNTQVWKPPTPASGGGYTYTYSGDYWHRVLAVAFTFTASATAAGRTLAVQFIDGDGYVINSTPVAAGILASQVVSCYADLANSSPQDTVAGFTGHGSLTSPAAAATIATSGTVPAGSYRVYATVSMAGTLAQGVDNDNVKLISTAGQAFVLNNVIAAGDQPFGPFQMDLPAAGTILLQTGATTPTVGSIYSGVVTAIPADSFADVTLPDLTGKSGWGVQIAVGNVQAGDQLSAIGITEERYPSNWADGSLRADEEDLARRLVRWLREQG